MGKRKENEPRVYIIPKNFLDSGYVFGGRFKQRNFIEAAALTAPVFGIFLYGWKVVGWDVGSTVAACIILCTGVFMAAVAGIGGDSLLEFLGRVQHFRKTKQISKYNPRVKLEYEPEYLKKTRQNLPREKLLELAKSLEGKILGDDGLPVSADITDERLVVRKKAMLSSRGIFPATACSSNPTTYPAASGSAALQKKKLPAQAAAMLGLSSTTRVCSSSTTRWTN